MTVRSLNIPTHDAGRLSATASIAGEELSLVLGGTAETPEEPHLASVLKRVHSEAEHQHIRKVNIDVRALRFMTSNCFKHFVAWVRAIGDLPKAERYPIHFTSNPAVRWQRSSLHALQCFGVDLVSVSEMKAAEGSG